MPPRAFADAADTIDCSYFVEPCITPQTVIGWTHLTVRHSPALWLVIQKQNTCLNKDVSYSTSSVYKPSGDFVDFKYLYGRPKKDGNYFLIRSYLHPVINLIYFFICHSSNEVRNIWYQQNLSKGYRHFLKQYNMLKTSFLNKTAIV